ncbi:hypothetical protein ACFVR6_05915 [Microbacterium sp. NPDC058021]|uniref:hypothetical protein n=1 Tax=Microbacterium sp. NPDC058021 TaxID=3346306 RepID=UPI0036DB6A5C
MAALGFLMGVRSNILITEPDTFDWLVDLIGKLGEEEDAYHATCLLLVDYGTEFAVDEEEDVEPAEEMIEAAGVDEAAEKTS